MIDFGPMRSTPEHPLKIWRLSQIPPLSQAAAGRRLGLSDMAVSRYERWKMPEFEVLLVIHKITRLEPNDFFKPLRIPLRAKARGGRNGRQT